MNWMRAWVIVLVFSLSGCIGAIVAGSAATGIAVYDGRGLVMLERDTRIFHLVHTAIVTNPQLRGSHIDVSSFNQVVLLVGQTPVAAQRSLAEAIAKRTPNVRRVYNEITIGQPTELTLRANDSWISGEVRSQMLLRRGLESGSIHIVTENAVVYLQGRVSQEQANLAVDVARHVKGVRRVVKVFQYLN
jgi:osmotically-inducible protein OsmY